MAAEIHTRQLRYFLAVAETGSYRQAARRLYVSQPSLSRAIKQLEQSLGTRLFDRSTRGTELTAAGFSIVEPARRLIESLDRAGTRIRPRGVSSVTWRIAYIPESLERALGCVVSAIARTWPEQDFVCHEMQQAEVADAVLAGSCDLGLGIGPASAAGLSGEQVGEEHLAALVRWQHGLPPGPLSVGDLRGRTIVLPPARATESADLLVRRELTALSLRWHAANGDLASVWCKGAARPGVAFALLDNPDIGKDGLVGWVPRELPDGFTIGYQLYWADSAEWKDRGAQVAAQARLAWLGPAVSGSRL